MLFITVVEVTLYNKHKGIAVGFDDWGPSQTSYSYHIQSTHIKGVSFDVVYMLVVVIFLQRLHLLHTSLLGPREQISGWSYTLMTPSHC